MNFISYKRYFECVIAGSNIGYGKRIQFGWWWFPRHTGERVAQKRPGWAFQRSRPPAIYRNAGLVNVQLSGERISLRGLLLSTMVVPSSLKIDRLIFQYHVEQVLLKACRKRPGVTGLVASRSFLLESTTKPVCCSIIEKTFFSDRFLPEIVTDYDTALAIPGGKAAVSKTIVNFIANKNGLPEDGFAALR